MSEKKRKEMKRIILLLGLGLFLAGSCFAQGDYTGRFSVGPQLIYIDLEDDDYDSEIRPGIMAKYFVMENFALAAGLGFFDWEEEDYSETSEGILFEGEAEGSTEITPLTLTAQCFLPSLNESLRFYLGGGMGYYFNTTDVKGIVTAAGMTWDFSADIDDAVGFHMVGGLQWTLAKNLLFDFALKYAWAEADGEIAISGPGIVGTETGSIEFDLDAFMVEVGGSYLF